jgi:hypothetical protein
MAKTNKYMKDHYDCSPAQNPDYNYKAGVTKGINASEVKMEARPMYTKMERASQSKMAKMEQDRDMD